MTYLGEIKLSELFRLRDFKGFQVCSFLLSLFIVSFTVRWFLAQFWTELKKWCQVLTTNRIQSILIWFTWTSSVLISWADAPPSCVKFNITACSGSTGKGWMLLTTMCLRLNVFCVQPWHFDQGVAQETQADRDEKY